MAVVTIPFDELKSNMWDFIFSSCHTVIKLSSETPRYPGDKKHKTIYLLEGAGLPQGNTWVYFIAFPNEDQYYMGYSDGQIDGWYTSIFNKPCIVKWNITYISR